MTVIIAVAGIIVILLVLEIIRELRTFRVTEYEIVSEKLNEMSGELKVLILSDLHNHVYEEGNKDLLEKIKETAPDLILIAGDMLVSRTDASVLETAEFVKKLTKTAPVFYGNGNHEQRFKEYVDIYGDTYRTYKESLEAHGVVFLENTSEIVRIKNAKLCITGIELPLSLYRKFYQRKPKIEADALLPEVCGNAERLPQAYRILIAHNPVYAKAYAKAGADLTVSGHLHGGIIRIPFLGGLITPQASLFPKHYGGCYHVGGMELVVSRGLGTHTINIRLFNEAELVLLRLKGKVKDDR